MKNKKKIYFKIIEINQNNHKNKIKPKRKKILNKY